MNGFLRFLKYAAIALAGLGFAVAVGVGIYVWSISDELPDSETLAHYEPPITTRVHANDGTLIAEFARERRLFVPVKDMPIVVTGAFLSAEDKNFYSHPGIDLFGIIRALTDNVYNYLQGADKRPEGASTITQQVAKNFFLTNEVSVKRKVQEMLLAFRIEDAYAKDKILELYLNEIFLGQNSYGVAAAALNYFDKSLDELTIAEAAYLAALPKAPSDYHPVRQRDRAIIRRNWVIDQMLENGYVTAEQAASSKAEDLKVIFRPLGAQTQDYQWFAEEVRRVVHDRYGEQSLYDGGLSVRSTLDVRMQHMALTAFRDGIQDYDRRHGWRGPVTKIELGDGWEQRLAAVPYLADLTEWRLAVVTKVEQKVAEIAFADGGSAAIPFDHLKWARPYITDRSTGGAPSRATDVLTAGDVVYVEPVPPTEGEPAPEKPVYALRQLPAVNGGLIAIDPHSGRVLALVGGFSFYDSVFNRATQAMRQTGSAFKPLVFAAALDSGYTPSTRVLDGPFVAPQGPGLPLWKPQNYSGDFMGLVTLRVGLAQSRNLVTVRLANDIGMPKVVDYAIRFGVVDKMDPYLSFALGAAETTLMRLTGAYSVFVNGGKRVQPTLIDRIQDRYGRTIYRHDDRVCEGCVTAEGWRDQEEPALPDIGVETLDARTAYQMVALLEGVVQRGTATTVKTVGIPLAGKTGTTNDEKDAWFVGFAPDLVVGIYVGFDQPRPMGRGETGGHVAAPIFRDFMKAAMAGHPGIPFRIPPGVVLMRVNARSGQLTDETDPNGILEPFKPGTDPTSRGALTSGSPDGETGYGESGEPEEGGVSTGTGGLY